VLSLDAVHAERGWSDELVARLRLLSEAFANALERRRMEVALAERLAFERVLSSLSTTFSAVSAVDFDREVQQGLRRIADVLDVDRGALIEFSPDTTVARIWTTDDAMRPRDLPWTVARLQRGEVVPWMRIEHLPADAAEDRRSGLARGVDAQVALPLLAGEVVIGGLLFAAGRRRPACERNTPLQGLRIVGEVFANALARTRGDQEMQRLRQELAHIGRVSAMGELTASLAHELNQPLAAILSNAQAARIILGRPSPDLDEVREILGEVVEDDERAGQVIKRLRSLYRNGHRERAPLDVNELIREVLRLLQNDVLLRGAALRLDLAGGLPPVQGDRIQLQQVMLNLMMNGLDAMRDVPSGQRSLTVRSGPDGPGNLRIEVADTGPGVRETDRERLFEPFFTTKPSGMGMGLPIARSIVEAHGGELSLVSPPGAGAVFQLTIPVRGN
jgi:signal transduction histidine kinase